MARKLVTLPPSREPDETEETHQRRVSEWKRFREAKEGKPRRSREEINAEWAAKARTRAAMAIRKAQEAVEKQTPEEAEELLYGRLVPKRDTKSIVEALGGEIPMPQDRFEELVTQICELNFNKTQLAGELGISPSQCLKIIGGHYKDVSSPQTLGAVNELRKAYFIALRSRILSVDPDTWSELWNTEYTDLYAISKVVGIPSRDLRSIVNGDINLGDDINGPLQDCQVDGVENLKERTKGRLFKIALEGDQRNAIGALREISKIGIKPDGQITDDARKANLQVQMINSFNQMGSGFAHQAIGGSMFGGVFENDGGRDGYLPYREDSEGDPREVEAIELVEGDGDGDSGGAGAAGKPARAALPAPSPDEGAGGEESGGSEFSHFRSELAL